MGSPPGEKEPEHEDQTPGSSDPKLQKPPVSGFFQRILLFLEKIKKIPLAPLDDFFFCGIVLHMIDEWNIQQSKTKIAEMAELVDAPGWGPGES